MEKFCKYCESKIFDEDRTCPKCGAPIKDSIRNIGNKTENITRSISEKDAVVYAISVVPPILILDDNYTYRQLQVIGIRGGLYNSIDITNSCKYEVKGNQFSVNSLGLVTRNENTKSGDREKLSISYINQQGKLLTDECIASSI